MIRSLHELDAAPQVDRRQADFQHVIAPAQPNREPRDATPAAPEPGWVSLFNRAAYHALNLPPGAEFVRLRCTQDGRELGSISGVIAGGRFVNGHRAPFGGIDLARPRETPANVEAIVTSAIEQLEQLGVTEAEIRLRPSCYSPSEPLILFTLLNHGFGVARAELNQHIDLTGIASADDYVATLRSPARRALGHLASAGLTMHEVHDDAGWDRAYAILAANRAARGRRLSLSRDELATTRRALAPHVRMFELESPEGPCAAALVYRVLPEHELVVAWGDSGHAFARSPMNMLALLTVERALAEGVVSLDLAISNEPDPTAPIRVNTGLVQFKQSVGALTEPRLQLTRAIG